MMIPRVSTPANRHAAGELLPVSPVAPWDHYDAAWPWPGPGEDRHVPGAAATTGWA